MHLETKDKIKCNFKTFRDKDPISIYGTAKKDSVSLIVKSEKEYAPSLRNPKFKKKYISKIAFV